MAQSQLPEPSIVDVLLCDHRDTMALLNHYTKQSKQSGNELMLEMLTDAIALSIRLHSQAEFDVLYPWVEKQGGEVKHFMEAHTGIEELVLEALDNRKNPEQGIETVKQILQDFQAHLLEEEEILTEVFASLADTNELSTLASRFMQAKEKAPLTPPPSVVS